MVEPIQHSTLYERKKIRLFDSHDLEEDGQIELSNAPNIEMVKLIVLDHYYLILENVDIVNNGETENGALN